MEEKHAILVRPCNDTCSRMAQFNSSMAARCDQVILGNILELKGNLKHSGPTCSKYCLLA